MLDESKIVLNQYFCSSKIAQRALANETTMGLTNQEFFKESMYFTDEVKLRIEGENKFVNEFLVCNNIGRGSYSKVKRVIRLEHGSDTMVKL
jgi:hypothetical protein